MNKKGQAMREFMLTYGWAIAVVAIAVIVLFWTGAWSKDKFMPTNSSIREYNHPTHVYMIYGEPGNCMCQIPDLNQTFPCDDKAETQQRCVSIWKTEGWWVEDITQFKIDQQTKINSVIMEIEYIQSYYELKNLPLEHVLDFKGRANLIKLKVDDANNAKQLNMTNDNMNILLSDIDDFITNEPDLETDINFKKIRVEEK